MGLRGPLRDPHSTRGQREGIVIDSPERPRTPKWLASGAKRIFRDLVADLVAARVPIKAVDAHAIAMAAHCIGQVEYWAEQQELPNMPATFRQECAALVARFQRDAQEWVNVIGASPKSRAQMGLRGQKEAPKQAGALSVFAARRA